MYKQYNHASSAPSIRADETTYGLFIPLTHATLDRKKPVSAEAEAGFERGVD